MSAVLHDVAAVPPADSAKQPESLLLRLTARVENSDSLSSLLAIFDQGMISGTNFLTAVIVGRCCGAETLGTFSLVASALALLLGVQEQLITAPYMIYHSRRRAAGLRRYQGSITLHQLLLTAVVVIVMGCLHLSSGAGDSLFASLSLTLAFAVPAMLLRGFVREMALAHCRVVTVVLVDATVCVTQVVLVIGLFWTDRVALPVIYATMGTACLLTWLVWLRRHGSQISFSRRSIGLDWLRNWRFGRWALATHIAGTSTPYIMPWVLYVVHGEAATGFLASCSVIVGVANILLSGISDFLTPRAAAAWSEGGLQGLRKVLHRAAGFSALAIGSVCVVSWLFGEQVISLLYDGRFPGAGELVVLLTLSVLANAMGSVAGNGLWALNQPRANFVADMITLTSAIAAALVFVKPQGPKGAAIAILVASVIGAVSRIGILQQHIQSLSKSRKKTKMT